MIRQPSVFKRVDGVISPKVDGDSFDMPVGRCATVVVAAADSSALSKQQADVVCTGTDDQGTINDAIDDMTSGRTWYESIVCVPGNYNISGIITLPDYTTFKMQGKITLANGSNCHMIRNADTSGGNNHIKIIGGIYDGNYAGQTTGDIIRLQNTDHICIDGVDFTDGTQWGIKLSGCEHFTIKNCFADDGGADDVYTIEESSKHGFIQNCISYNHTGRKGAPLMSDFELENGIEDVIVDNCKCFGGVNEIGINVEGTGGANKDITVSNCIVENKTEYGFSAMGVTSGAASERITFSNCIAKNITGGDGHGVYINNVDELSIMNCHVTSSGGEGLFLGWTERAKIIGSTFNGNGDPGIGIHGCHDTIISASFVESNSDYGISVLSSSTKLTIEGTRIISNTKKGVYVNSSSDITILGCFFDDNTQEAIGIYKGYNITISGSIFTNGNEEGIYTMSSSPISQRIVISGSIFSNNTKDAIRLSDANYVSIIGCTFYSNTLFGVNEEATVDYTLLDGCTFISNGWTHNVNAAHSVVGDIIV